MEEVVLERVVVSVDILLDNKVVRIIDFLGKEDLVVVLMRQWHRLLQLIMVVVCLLYTSDAADE